MVLILKHFIVKRQKRISKSKDSSFVRKKRKFNLTRQFKAINQPGHVTSIHVITNCKVIQKLITEMAFPYHIKVKKRAKKVYKV